MSFTDPPADCQRCSRLVAFRKDWQQKEPQWFNGAVPSFGDEKADLLIIGLAPGVRGANATGRPFTGDYAGDLLYETLLKFDFAQGQYEAKPDDGLKLVSTGIINAVRCVPPANKPTLDEIKTCNDFLKTSIDYIQPKVILCLGRVSHDATLRSFGLKMKDFPFAHGSEHLLPSTINLISSYHCSRYNTQTKRLTTQMFEDIFEVIKGKL